MNPDYLECKRCKYIVPSSFFYGALHLKYYHGITIKALSVAKMNEVLKEHYTEYKGKAKAAV